MDDKPQTFAQQDDSSTPPSLVYASTNGVTSKIIRYYPMDESQIIYEDDAPYIEIASVSPDNTRLAIWRHASSRNLQPCVIELDNASMRCFGFKITSFAFNHDLFNRNIQWIDANTIAFLAEEERQFRLVEITLNEPDRFRTIYSYSETYEEFSPTIQWSLNLAYVYVVHFDVDRTDRFVVDLSTGEEREIPDNLRVDDGGILCHSLTPDSELVAIVQVDDSYVFRLLNLDTSTIRTMPLTWTSNNLPERVYCPMFAGHNNGMFVLTQIRSPTRLDSGEVEPGEYEIYSYDSDLWTQFLKFPQLEGRRWAFPSHYSIQPWLPISPSTGHVIAGASASAGGALIVIDSSGYEVITDPRSLPDWELWITPHWINR